MKENLNSLPLSPTTKEKKEKNPLNMAISIMAENSTSVMDEQQLEDAEIRPEGAARTQITQNPKTATTTTTKG